MQVQHACFGGALAQDISLKNGLAVIGGVGALWNIGQNRTKFHKHHGSANVCATG
jgi:hypothetical protein